MADDLIQITLQVAAAMPDDFVVDKVVVIVEGISVGDDDTVLWTTTSPRVKGWQTLGMLEACAARERRTLVDGFLEDED